MAAKKTWLVEAAGLTNEAIAAELAAMQQTERFHRDVLCQDGKKRDLWDVDYSFVTKLIKNEANLKLKFKVFCRDSPHGPVRLWPYLRKARQTLAQALEKGAVKRGVADSQSA